MEDMVSEPVIIRRALFWIVCYEEMFVLQVGGYQMGEAYVMIGLMRAL